MKNSLCFALLPFVLVACNSSNDDEVNTPVEPQIKQFRHDFSQDVDIWTAGFADYPVGEEAFYELDSNPMAEFSLVNQADLTPIGYQLSGNNHSSDLFMYIKTSMTELDPGVTYSVHYELELAVNYGPGCFGIGGAPGESVWLKTGIANEEPIAIIAEKQPPYYLMNWSIGGQSNDGDDAIVIGNYTSEDVECAGEGYALVTHNNEDKPFVFTNDDSTDAWLLIGLDSGFEGKTTTYLTKYNIELIPTTND